MSLSQKIIAIISFMLSMSGFVIAQDDKLNQTKQIKVCPFRLTEAGRAPSVRINFLYQLKTDSIGEVTNVTELTDPKRGIAKFVRHELFVECMKQWRLEPAGKYYVSFYVGTTSSGLVEGMPFNSMRIIDPNKKVMIIELSPSENEVLKIDEPKKQD